MTWEEALTLHCARLAAGSPHTARNARTAAVGFFQFVGVDLAALTLAQLEQYRQYLAARAQAGTLSYTTMNEYLKRMRLFLREAAPALGHTQIDAALKAIKARVEHPYEILTDEEIKRMFDLADAEGRAILALGIFAGLRLSEIAGLEARHLIDDQRGAAVHVERGKGRKDRTVPIKPDVYALLHAYAATRAGMLFTSEYVVYYRVRTLAKRAGVQKRISTHSLRHTFAFRLAQANVPLIAISKLLGHGDVVTTLRYIDHLTASDVAQYAPSMTTLF